NSTAGIATAAHQTAKPKPHQQVLLRHPILMTKDRKADVVVVGAGGFGALVAYQLRLAGADVLLVDAYGPANSRASSGGESRILRFGYGPDEIYTRLAQRSLALWKQLFDAISRPQLFHPTGVLWLAREQ